MAAIAAGGLSFFFYSVVATTVVITTAVAAAVSSVETTTAAYGLSFFCSSAVAATTVVTLVLAETTTAFPTVAPAANSGVPVFEKGSCLRAAPFFCASFTSSYCIIGKNTLYFRKYIVALSRESIFFGIFHSRANRKRL